jgi:DNA mismatch repair protein MutS
MASRQAEPVIAEDELDEPGRPMASILFEQITAAPAAPPWPALIGERPAHFQDLNLDQVVEAITAGREEYDLESFFFTPLPTVAAVSYRHEVFRDLESQRLLSCVTSFAERMRSMRQQLAQAESLYYDLQKQAWFLDAVATYCEAVTRLADELEQYALAATALEIFRDRLLGYVRAPRFGALCRELDEVQEALATVHYCLQIRGTRIQVIRFEDDPDYSVEVERTFDKFKQGAVKDYRAGFRSQRDMNHVEAAIVALVAKLYPQAFTALESFCRRHRDFVDQLVAAFDREVQFYVASLEYLRRFASAGLPLCYPSVSDDPVAEGVGQAFDLALAGRLLSEQASVVLNDYRLAEPETAIVVTGPNQGGKTTFARMFGQLHYLASLGLPVPAEEARLSLFDELFTHFERQEDVTDRTGKLEDDLVRIKHILDRVTRRSVVVMNESFTSTTLEDARVLGKAVLHRLLEIGSRCVYVTFVDELACLGEGTVSMAGTVAPEDPTTRTFRIVRMPANGLAYAAAIAEKHGLTYGRIMQRRQRHGERE